MLPSRSKQCLGLSFLSSDAPMLLDVIVANAIHAIVQPYGRIAVIDPDLNVVPDIDGHIWVLDFDNRMFGVKRNQTNAFDVLYHRETSFATQSFPPRIYNEPL